MEQFYKDIGYDKFPSHTLIIAEIGQNHQGQLEIAKKMILACKKAGVDVVKFQKTDIRAKFNSKALSRSYINPNSWGETYLQHKEFLEFSKEEFEELQLFAQQNDILFTASGMDIPSFQYLNSINVPFFKIGSGDTNNLELIERVAKMGKWSILSTGMNDMESIKKSVDLYLQYNPKLILLQCTSSYPLPDSQVHLRTINTFKKEFPNLIVGYSGHEDGIAVSLGAIGAGAQVIERHVTLDKSLKGTDHPASLNFDELEQLVDGIRRIEVAMGSPIKRMQECEVNCWKKLGKSLVLLNDMKKGDILRAEDLTTKVADPKGINPNRLDEVVGMRLMRDKESDQSLEDKDLVLTNNLFRGVEY